MQRERRGQRQEGETHWRESGTWRGKERGLRRLEEEEEEVVEECGQIPGQSHPEWLRLGRRPWNLYPWVSLSLTELVLQLEAKARG